jgi:TnpA family transposase
MDSSCTTGPTRGTSARPSISWRCRSCNTFVARYLRLRDLQREIEEGLNVMGSSNGANFVIAYGKGGEIASNRRDEQEMFVLCLRILQSPSST